jgi:hypothetical protein
MHMRSSWKPRRVHLAALTRNSEAGCIYAMGYEKFDQVIMEWALMIWFNESSAGGERLLD